MDTGAAVIYVDGQEVVCMAGEPLVAVLERYQAGVPHVCYHEALGPIQTCDTCFVEVNGELQRACAVVAESGIRIETVTERAEAARVEGMNRLLHNHELYCTICDYNNGTCEVHNATAALGLEHQQYEFERKPYAVDDSNPFYQYDPDQCIACGRCVEACQNVQVTETLSIDWEAEVPRVQWDGGAKINESSCVSCGHCVTVCPCNALIEKNMIGEAGYFTDIKFNVRRQSIALVKEAEKYIGFKPIFALSDAEAKMREQTIKKTKTVCTYCGVGCAFDIWTKGRKVLKVEPQLEAPANGISTCIKGKFQWDYVNSDQRLTHPLVRDEDPATGELHFREASWDEALGQVVERFQAIAAEYGPDSVAFVSSSKTTNEEAYLVQKIARAIFKTNNVDNCARYCQSPASKGLSRTVGVGADAGTMHDMEKADVVFIVGSNTNTSHPVLAARLKRQQKLHGQFHIVSDLREHEMARRADIFLRPNPGTDLIWVNAVARYIVEQGWQDDDFIAERVNHFDEYKASLEPFTIDYAEQRTGLAAETLRTVAEKIAKAERVCGLWAMGVTQHIGGTDTCTAMCNLLLLTGNFGKPGTGGYPLRGHNNVQGASDFGALYNFLPGYHKVTDDEARRRCAAAWNVDDLSTETGLNNKTMIDAIYDGKLKALFVVGEEMSLVDSNINHVQEAFKQLDFFVVQDIFMSRTAEFADVVLAASPSLEKDGTFVNTERRIQRLYRALDPLGNSRPDWQILTDLAYRLGHNWGYTHPSEIMDEVAACTPEFAGVSYERLEGYKSLCWPVAEDGTDTPLLYTDRFKFPDGKARFFPVEFTEPTSQPGEEYDLHVNNGRVLEHFHEGNMTYKTNGIGQKVADVYIEVSQALAEQRGLEEGEWVRLTSPYGSLKTRVVVSDEVRDHELYMPLCSPTGGINLLTSSEADPVVDTPVYKEVAVKLEKTGDRKGASPVPRTNPRYGNPTPQKGVEVERKWARTDYVQPPRRQPPGGRV